MKGLKEKTQSSSTPAVPNIVLKTLMDRKGVLLCLLSVAAIAAIIWLLLPLVPRKAKPERYRTADIEIPSITQVVGYRELSTMTQDLTGTGKVTAATFQYINCKTPADDIITYSKSMQDNHSAIELESNTTNKQNGTVSLLFEGESKQVIMDFSYDSNSYEISMQEKEKPKPSPDSSEHAISPEKAREILLTLTKAETGFKADISVYTSNLLDEIVKVDGWDYYAFEVVADYPDGRIDYRGTFYISCDDGVILKYDKDTNTTSRVRQ